WSDYVGRVQIKPNKYLDLTYRFRIGQEEFETRKSEISLIGGPDIFRLEADYMFINASQLTGYPDREEIYGRLSSQITDSWNLFTHARYDLSDEEDPISVGGGVQYENDCFTFKTNVTRTFTQDRDYEGGYNVLLTLVFKTLG